MARNYKGPGYSNAAGNTISSEVMNPTAVRAPQGLQPRPKIPAAGLLVNDKSEWSHFSLQTLHHRQTAPIGTPFGRDVATQKINHSSPRAQEGLPL